MSNNNDGEFFDGDTGKIIFRQYPNLLLKPKYENPLSLYKIKREIPSLNWVALCDLHPDDALEALISYAEIDPLFWGLFYWGRAITKPYSMIHRIMIDNMLFGSDYNYTILPRGFGKSTTEKIAITWAVHNIDHVKFIVSISASDDLSKRIVMQPIRGFYEQSARLHAVYGDPISRRKWASGEIEIVVRDRKTMKEKKRVVLWTRGVTQAMRGMVSDVNRPDWIILDDAEKKDDVTKQEYREEFMENYLEIIEPALDNEIGKISVVGTILHQDSFLAKIRDHADYYKGVFIQALYKDALDNWRSVWEERHPTSQLLAKMASWKKLGKLASFYKEYMNEPQIKEMIPFPKEKILMFRYDKMSFVADSAVAFLDPAYTTNRQSDFSGISILARRGKDVYVPYAKGIKMQIDDVVTNYAKTVIQYRKLGFRRIYVETDGGGGELIVLNLKKEFISLGYPDLASIVEGFRHKGGRNAAVRKKDRIVTAIRPLITSGNIFFEIQETTDALAQMDDFNRGIGHDDILDSIASAVILLPDSDMKTLDKRKRKWYDEDVDDDDDEDELDDDDVPMSDIIGY